MPTFYNYRENGETYSFDDVFVPKDAFAQGLVSNWGDNSYGQLGVNNLRNFSQPTAASASYNWKQIEAGNFHTASIRTDGTLWIWGYGQTAALGNNTFSSRSNAVTTFAGGTNWKQVSCGRDHTAAIKTDGTLWVWGENLNGELGVNASGLNNYRTTPTTTFLGGTNWKQVSCGDSNTAAIKTDGTLWTWGINAYGLLGTNTFGGDICTPVTTFAGGTNWKQVSGSFNSRYAVKTDGTLWTWGRNNAGQLGILQDSVIYVLTPVTTFAGGTDWAIIANGDSVQSLDYNAFDGKAATKTDGTLWIWGNNNFGQVGNNSIIKVPTPITTFAGGTNWKQINSSAVRVYAIKTDGTLWGWGRNSFGEQGNRILQPSGVSTPITTFAGGNDWQQVAGGDNHTAAIKTDGTLWIWGQGSSNGRLGTNTTPAAAICTPVTTFAGGTNWKQVSTGEGFTAAIKTDGTLWTWGSSFVGQLGQLVRTDRSTPVTTFAGGTNWKHLSCGGGHVAAIKTDGTLWTWGYNVYGQLGTNALSDISTPTTTFLGGTNWKQVSCGSNHTAATKTDGTLWTWGRNNYGQLGDNGFINRCTPVTTFAGENTWMAVSCHANALQTTAIKSDGTLWTWGYNYTGSIGINKSPLFYIITPVTTFAGGNNWKQVDSGSSIAHVAATKTDGTLWTWGFNSYGQLGTNTSGTGTSNDNKATPVTTFAGGTDWKQVACGEIHTAAIKTDGTLWTWGLNTAGQLGDFTVISRSTPVTTISGRNLWKQVSCGSNHTAATEVSTIYI